MNCTETRHWLAAHRDGELDLARDSEVSAHLQTCTACAAAARARDEWKTAVRETAPRYKPSSAFAERMRRDVQSGTITRFEPKRSSPVQKNFGWLGNTLVPIAAALAVGFFIGQQRSTSRHLGEELLANHTFALVTPDRLTEVASSDRHTVKPWLAQHLDFSPPVVDLASEGFPLAGGRVDRLEKQPVAALVYHRHNHVITVFVWPKDGQHLPGAFLEHGYHAVPWQQADWNYVAISDLAADDLGNFVEQLKAALR